MITIVTCTYFASTHNGQARMEAAGRSVRSWFSHLYYPELALHVADDGSDPDLWSRFKDYLGGIRVSYSRQERHGIGASLNAGLARAWDNGLAFYIQDDLRLVNHVRLDFAAAILEQCEDVLAVRVGLPHPDTTGRVRYLPGLDQNETLTLELDPHHYVMSFRPFLAHKRMGTLGPYLADVTAEWCEKEYNDRYVKRPAGKVLQWMPNLWVHQHVVNLGIIEPQGGV